MFPLVPPCYPLLPLVPLVLLCYPLLPLVPLCYPLFPYVLLVTLFNPLLPLVTPCYSLFPLFTCSFVPFLSPVNAVALFPLFSPFVFFIFVLPVPCSPGCFFSQSVGNSRKKENRGTGETGETVKQGVQGERGNRGIGSIEGTKGTGVQGELGKLRKKGEQGENQCTCKNFIAVPRWAPAVANSLKEKLFECSGPRNA